MGGGGAVPATLPRDSSSSSLDEEEYYGSDDSSYSPVTEPPRSLRDAMDFIRRYRPGCLVRASGEYELPERTVLLLIGPKGSGKSRLVNRITSMFDEQAGDAFAPERAQVYHTSTLGTCFLSEYMVPRESSCLCLYDSRGLPLYPSVNSEVLRSWIVNGVHHGQMIVWDSDDVEVREKIRDRSRGCERSPSKMRTVNFAIFVVNGVSLLNSLDGDDNQYVNIIVETFNFSFLSFRDSKPAVALTYGDELSMWERMRITAKLEELLNIPSNQIFDISGGDTSENDFAMVDMLRYCIEHAEQNFPFNHSPEVQGSKMDMLQDLGNFINIALIVLCAAILLLRLLDRYIQ